ncbi:thioesterase II family protein [Nocardia camponoti]|uniref:Thioesterase TesA n=1 Tax=Nocardia camponoti TaxID=1616106 RepID=A0A917Q8M5_9NOCA|nr:alpha/beta fold hydrolase [Nocardia camponoti]GGK34754.1 thioesterase [Nocardia camponoti]
MTTSTSNWLRDLRPDSAARLRLVCLPPGGGSAPVYRAIAKHIGAAVAVSAVQYPGRQDRLGEPLITDLHELADRIADDLLARPTTLPTALFGHSMGATVAYETALRLTAAGHPPTTLMVSGRPAPTIPETSRLHLDTDAALIESLERFAADPSSVAILRTEPGLADLVLPPLRADYQAVETYVRQANTPKLACPVVTLVSTDDPTTTIEQAEQWHTVTTGAFSLATFPGGHFYFDTDPTSVAAEITRHLS